MLGRQLWQSLFAAMALWLVVLIARGLFPTEGAGKPPSFPAGNGQPRPPSLPNATDKATATPAGLANPLDHDKHRAFVNRPPVRSPADPSSFPRLPRDGHGRAPLDWEILASTRVDKGFTLTYANALAEVDQTRVTLTGFMSPLDEVGDMQTFLLLEYPLGCFFCLTPPPQGIVLVSLPAGKTHPLVYDLVSVSGVLHLNRTNPEDFLYSIVDAEIAPAH